MIGIMRRKKMKIALLSDTHFQWDDLTVPECDLLISTGDYSGYQGNEPELKLYHKWLDKQHASEIISLQGNHEVWVESNFAKAKRLVSEISARIHFVAEEALEIQGIKIYCSSVTPWFQNWAWNLPQGEPIRTHWRQISDDTQVLVTHGPPYGILDQATEGGEHFGCPELLARIKELKSLKLHAFGHIHGGSGECEVDGIQFINASICNQEYRPVNPVRTFDFPLPPSTRNGLKVGVPSERISPA
jgi:Icc-related predicted phosphoesterase